jgi:hypothetical protein
MLYHRVCSSRERKIELKVWYKIIECIASISYELNYLVEGCEGGWPHFDAYFYEHAHLIAEDCAPYTGTTKGSKCSNWAQCPPVAKIQNTHFVGGGFAQVSEKQMMKDILRNGAITVEFEANKLFSMYKEGILTEKGMKGVKDAVMPENLASDLAPKQSLTDLADIVGMSQKDQDD